MSNRSHQAAPTATARRRACWAALLLILAPAARSADRPAAPAQARPQVVLLHGLARGSSSMRPMAQALEAAGYATCNIDYPSRHHDIATLAEAHVAPAIERCFADRSAPLHFVTHSMGGIVVRQLVATGRIQQVGRVVMLSPPNHGSEVVDRLSGWRLFRLINGPAGSELGTGPGAVPARLGPATFALGVITGSRSVNPLLSTLLPGTDDGKVTPASARLEGMQDFRLVPATHPFIMRDAEVIRQTLHFLKAGRFSVAPASGPQHRSSPDGP